MRSLFLHLVLYMRLLLSRGDSLGEGFQNTLHGAAQNPMHGGPFKLWIHVAPLLAIPQILLPNLKVWVEER